MTRPSWDDYFLEMAHSVSTRSTCNRKQVGCVLVRDNQLLSSGYGGSIKGQPHCMDEGCAIDEATGGCVRTVHAEMNAIAQAACNGVSVKGATAYCTLSPCNWCFKTLVNAGVTRIVYNEEYRIPPDFRLAAACGVQMQHRPLLSRIKMPAADLDKGPGPAKAPAPKPKRANPRKG